MDAGLIGWARAVKRAVMRKRGKIPALWLFTDAQRLPDPLPAIAQLPRGLCGVLFRHDDAPDRAGLGRKIAALCKARRLTLVVAGDARLAAALGAGLHLRGGRCGVLALPRLVTSSVHDQAELARARRAGAKLLFISPVFGTQSHPGGAALGPLRWRRLARQAGTALPGALGGMSGHTVRRLGPICLAVGAINALTPAQVVAK